jgi:hypothetical protein
MNFTVYVERVNGKVQPIAYTLFVDDARKVLSNWHKGYITDREGNNVESKGF